MPFGIPPTDPRPAAALDYCDATTQELVGLFESIVDPINVHISEIDAALASLMMRLRTFIGRQFGSLDRDFDLLTGDLTSYVNTIAGWYEVQLDQQSQLMDVGISLLPEPQRQQLLSVTAPVSLSAQGGQSVTTTVYNEQGQAVSPAAPSREAPITRPFATTTPNAGMGAPPVQLGTETITKSEALRRIGYREEIQGGSPFPQPDDPEFTQKLSDWVISQQILHQRAALPRPAPTPGVSAPAEKYELPPRPTYEKGPPCPRLPRSIEGLGAPMGSQVWCEAVDQLLTWLDDMGKQLVEWAEGSIQPGKWAKWVKEFHAPTDAYQWVKDIVAAIVELLSTAVELGGNALLYVSGAIQCLWYYSQVVTPIKNPGAYTALLFLRNILDWLRQSRIGSQSYLGFTLSTAITLPSLSRTVDALLDYLVPVEVPSLTEVRNAWLKGYIRDDKQVECLMRLNGANPNLWWTFFRTDQEQLSPEEALEFARRKGGDIDTQVEALRQLGYTDERIAKARVELYDKFPSINEHLHFLTRNVHDDAYVADFGLMDGFIDRFWKKFGNQLRALGMTEEIAGLHYAAHWLQPAPGELREFVYRQRAGRVPDGHEFTAGDYERVLAEKDVTPYFAKRFVDTLYRVPALSYLRDMHRMDLLTDEEMREYHRDLGYKEADSELFVKVDNFRKRRMRATQGSGWNPAALRRAFIVGQVKDEFVRDKMKYMGYSDQDATDLMERANAELTYRALSRSLSSQLTVTTGNVRQALSIGVMDVDTAVGILTGLGWDRERARGIAEGQAAMGKVERVKQTITAIRKAYLSGEIDGAYANDALTHLGLTDEAIGGYLYQWEVANTPYRKRRTAKETVDDAAHEWITEEEARAKWRNLGYEQNDIDLWWRQTLAKMEEVNEKAAKKAARKQKGMEEVP